MRYLVNAILCISWCLLCFSQGIGIAGGVGHAAIILIPALFISMATASIGNRT